MQLISHPEYTVASRKDNWEKIDGTPLKNHLLAVAADAEEVAQTHSTYRTEKIAYIAGLTHDIAKFTQAFQKYVRVEEISSKPENSHSYTSAVICWWALKQADFSPKEQLIGLLSVMHHHGELPNVKQKLQRLGNRIRDITQEYIDIIPQQIRDIQDKPQVERVLSELSSELNISSIDFDEFKSQMNRGFFHFSFDSAFHVAVLQVWSSLVRADKKHATGVDYDSPEPPDSTAIEEEVGFEEFIDGNTPDSELNRVRTSSQAAIWGKDNDIDERLENADSNIATITLPTGFGKTYAGLKTALDLAKRKDSRVIYALPYTSIIDQLDTEIRELFDFRPTGTEYTIHHHLAQTKTNPGTPDSEWNQSDRRMVAESWSSPIVLTTFVQLFESLASPSNRASVKLPSLEDAVLVIDEPQALPLKWWNAAIYLLSLAENQYNCHSILMTATNPKFTQLPFGSEVIELGNSGEEAYRFLSDNPRLSVSVNSSLTTYLDSWTAASSNTDTSAALPPRRAASKIEARQADTLAICNTKKTVRRISSCISADVDVNSVLDKAVTDSQIQTDSVDEMVDDLSKVVLDKIDENTVAKISITTNLRPIERQVLIQIAEELTGQETITVKMVTTQIIEAGVDIDFNVLYRDFAPLSSLVQAAGRCNREVGDDQGEMILWLLDAPNKDTIPAESVYDSDSTANRLKHTAAVIKKHTEANEMGEYTFIKRCTTEYYNTVHQQEYLPRDIVNWIDDAKFSDLRDASLIDGDEYQLIIPRNEREMKIARTYANQDTAEAGLKQRIKYMSISVKESVWTDTTGNEITEDQKLVTETDYTCINAAGVSDTDSSD